MQAVLNPPSTMAQKEAETTFRSYTHQQGTGYAQSRRDYPDWIYQHILEHHTSTGGSLDTILDVGCGPGTAVRRLALHFTHAIGLDPSEGMLSSAKSLGGTSRTAEPIRFEIATGEDLGSNLVSPIAHSSVDLVTAATAVHWFDLPRFWPRVAEVLKPGGTVALWCGGNLRVHPSTPNHAELQAVFDELDEKHLQPYMEKGNWLTRGLYQDLTLPWMVDEPVPELLQDSLVRMEAKEDSQTTPRTYTLEAFEKLFNTASPVVRWREAHPTLAGTEEDVLKVVRRKAEEILRKA
ncbi:methyltransferase [Xylariomycetidae sp. FL2044]|nr:methyltransferase [Xylariomycetidae sp. FL2044]